MAESKRKPLIQPGSMLRKEETQDAMSRILQRDREASGREAIETPIELDEAQQPSTEEADKLTSNITSKLTSNTVAAEELGSATPKKVKEKPKQTLKQRVAEMATTRHVVISLRCPEAINDWLDEYAHAHRKEGVKKQDLVAEALAMLILKKEGAEQTPDDEE